MHKNQDIRALFPPAACCAAPELILTTWRDAESSASRETQRKPEEAPVVFKKPDYETAKPISKQCTYYGTSASASICIIVYQCTGTELLILTDLCHQV